MLYMSNQDPTRSHKLSWSGVYALLTVMLLWHQNAAGQSYAACAEMHRPQTAQQIHLQKIAIGRRALHRSASSAVHILQTLSQAEWTVVFAQVQGAEQGVFFFRGRPENPALITVWGGSPGPESVADIASTLDPSLPATLRACTAEAIHRTF